MKGYPLDDLEMYELLCAAYPKNFKGDDSDEDFESVEEFLEEQIARHGITFIYTLLGRIVMLAPVLESQLSGNKYHALGKRDGDSFIAMVRREVVNV